jgi:hypothetical protein
LSRGFEDSLFGHLADSYGLQDKAKDELVAIADAIRGSLFRQQRQLIEDPYRRKAALCPRRAGKSYTAMSYAFDVCLRKRNAKVAIINVSLKVGRRNYWDEVVPVLVEKFGIPCKKYQNELRIQLSNGSLIYLLGADKRDAIEDIRGTQLDLVIVDEAKSYPAPLLDELVHQVLAPTLRDRKGTMMMIGTPGSVFQGPFFEATYPGHKFTKGKGKSAVELLSNRTFESPERYWLENPKARPKWSRHTWQITDNVAVPHLWDEAVQEKDDNGWADDEPIWLRESLAQWVTGANEFVYAYANLFSSDSQRVHWTPDFVAGNKHGLPDNAEWRYLLGIDTGYVDAFAMVVGAYNVHDGVLYHVEDFHESRLDPLAQAAEIQRLVRKYGRFDAIVVDPGGGGKGLAEMVRQRMQIAEKTHKNAYTEFVNADFRAGRIKIIPRSDLATQLSTLQFDLSSGKSIEELARRERLTENKSQANDLCDAFLYMWRWSYHYYRRDRHEGAEPGTPEYELAQHRAAQNAYAAKQRAASEALVDTRGWTANTDPLAEYRRPWN